MHVNMCHSLQVCGAYMLRRTCGVMAQYLPRKVEQVLFCRMSNLQVREPTVCFYFICFLVGGSVQMGAAALFPGCCRCSVLLDEHPAGGHLLLITFHMPQL